MGLTTESCASFRVSEKEDAVRGSALGLALQCLSFDFVGIFPDESSEDMGTVQMPLPWRPLIQDLSNLELFFQLYHTSRSARRQQALQCIVQLASIRRSLFQTEQDRKNFLSHLLRKVLEIMESRVGELCG